MKFGLWVEPERADQTARWCASTRNSSRRGPASRSPGCPTARRVHLCLGSPAVQQWMAADMIRVVTDYGVDWLKWDYNLGYGLGCDAGDHGHQHTDGHYAHTLGLYRVFKELRQACPDLVIENCASGGHRVDLGTLRHSHTNWVSDYTARAASCRQHAQGAGLFLPLAHVNTWALEDRDLTGFRSRMGGAFGVSSFMGEWSADERETFGVAVSEYRRLRPYLAGERYLLTGPWHGDWDIWQLVHPSGDAFAIVAFHERGSVPELRVVPKAVQNGRTYTIERSSGTSSRVSGVGLATEGIGIDLPGDRTSEITWVRADND